MSLLGPDDNRASANLRKIQDVYAQYWNDLCGFIRARFGAGPPDPEDIAQSTFLKYAEAADKSAILNTKAFLFKTARNLVVDYHRSPKNLMPTEDQINLQNSSEKSDEADPQNVTMSRQELFLLEKAIMALPERDRSFLLMHRLEDMSYTEIAEQANMSRSGVQKIITLALEKCVKAVQAGSGT